MAATSHRRRRHCSGRGRQLLLVMVVLRGGRGGRGGTRRSPAQRNLWVQRVQRLLLPPERVPPCPRRRSSHWVVLLLLWRLLLLLVVVVVPPPVLVLHPHHPPHPGVRRQRVVVLSLVPGCGRGAGAREGGGDLQVVGDAQVGVEVEEGGGDVAADGALLRLPRAEVNGVDVAGQGSYQEKTGRGKSIKFRPLQLFRWRKKNHTLYSRGIIKKRQPRIPQILPPSHFPCP